VVVLGGTSYNDTGWLADAYDAGARGSFDVLATHPDVAPSDAGPHHRDDGSIWTLDHVRAVRALMRAEGDGRLPIWFTELGWSSHPNDASTRPWEGVSEAQQASYLVAALDLIRGRYPYVTHVFWYASRDRSDSSAQDNHYGPPDHRPPREARVPGAPGLPDVAAQH
jgi:polysaccharide biosynthesis protein PslG